MSAWRPLSLINTDAKIGTKALAMRIQKVLPSLIHSDQHAYVGGRSISDAVRSIEDVINFTESQNTEGLLVAIDFQKAFDLLSRKFLLKALRNFNFGESFVKWVEIFHTQLLSCVMNNGYGSPFFDVKSGVRQGDPLSPYLFIVALETLACYIRENEKIKGVSIGKKVAKLSIFTDDLTVYLRDKF